MDDIWALVLGILFLVFWVCFITYADVLRRAYTLGRIDKIERRNRTIEYTGLACRAYNHGRRVQAKRHRLSVTSKRGRISGNPAKASHGQRRAS